MNNTNTTLCDRKHWTGRDCTETQEHCGDLEWGAYISLHLMGPTYRYGYQDRPSDMPAD